MVRNECFFQFFFQWITIWYGFSSNKQTDCKVNVNMVHRSMSSVRIALLRCSLLLNIGRSGDRFLIRGFWSNSWGSEFCQFGLSCDWYSWPEWLVVVIIFDEHRVTCWCITVTSVKRSDASSFSQCIVSRNSWPVQCGCAVCASDCCSWPEWVVRWK